MHALKKAPVRPTARLVVATVSLILVADAAYAQDDTPDEAIDEIVVKSSYTTGAKLDTATGLGLSIGETPQSVSVMTFQRMLDQNLLSLSDVVINAAGISAKELDSSRDTFAARGFAIENYQIDGIPMEWSSGGDAGETQTDTTLYERIEVVRGATGLLTGAGNPSASINLVRKHADSREFTGFGRLGFGRWNTRSAMVDVSTPLNGSGSIRGRAVLNYEDGESFVDLMEDTKRVGYVVVDADVTEKTLMRAGLSHQDNDPSASTWGGLPSWYADGSRTDWPRSKTIAADWTRWASTNENQFVNVSHSFGESWEARFDFNKFQNDAELALLYLFGAPDRDTGVGLGASPYRSDTSRDQDALSFQVSGLYSLMNREHEIAFGYADIRQDYVALYFPNDSTPPIGDFNAWDGSYPQPGWGDPVVDIDLETKQTGFYAATRLHLSDGLRFITGGRVASWETSGDRYGSVVGYGDDDVLIPYAGVLYDVRDSQTVYASYTEIFKPQSALDRNGNQLDPLVGKSYEAGLKSAYFDGAVQTTIAVFRIDQDNLAEPDTGHLIPGTIFEASRAAQGTVSEGFEVEVVGSPTPGWDVSLSYTNFDAEDADGIEVSTNQPREIAKLFTTYRFQDALERLTVGGGINWQGETFTRAVNPVTSEPARLEQEAYTLATLMARFDFSEALSAQLNVDNLLDETYYSQIGFYSQLAYGRPRNVSLNMRYTF